MERGSNKQKKIFLITIFASLLLHILFVVYKTTAPIKSFTQLQNRKKLIETKKPMKVVQLNDEELQKIKAKIKNQIVETHDSDLKPKKEIEAFLGEKDNFFERQTVSLNNASFNKEIKKSTVAKGDVVIKEAEVAQKKVIKNTKTNSGALSKVESKQLLKDVSESLSLKDLAFGGPKKDLLKEEHRENIENEANKRGQTQKFDDKNQVAGSNDYIKDLPLGDLSNLNTQEFKYYGFYHRIKQQLEQFWGSSVQEKVQEIYKSGRRIASDDRITSLVVELDEKGKITNITVKGTSGLAELDQVAIESFNKAGPFPNPPRGMIRNGTATIEWGFVLRG